MFASITYRRLMYVLLLACSMTGCFSPPFNEFKPSGNPLGFVDSDKTLIKKLEKRSMQVIQYGRRTTIIIPTDRYFVFNTAQLNELGYRGLYNLKEFINKYPKAPIYVAAFTDNVGGAAHKRALSTAQAHTILTFLWANGIPASHLTAEGYSDQFPVGDNQFIHSSAYNRRIEIQWSTPICSNHCKT